jgi:hypothetical protein
MIKLNGPRSPRDERRTDENSTVPKSDLKSVEIIAVIGAVTFFVLAVSAYIRTFGMVISDSHEKWGLFGDFMGGFLNPIYALLAFLAVLLTLSEQRKGQRRAQLDFQEEKDRLKETAFKEDVYRIVKEIDRDIDGVLEMKVGGVEGFLTIDHMAYEAERQRNISPKEAPYADFIGFSKDTATDVGIACRRLTTLIEELYRNLRLYNSVSDAKENPLIGYFARKNARLMQMFKDIGDGNREIIGFFEHQ